MREPKHLLCLFAPTSGGNAFADRISIWGKFITGNNLREDHDVLFLLPTSYEGESRLYDHFRLSELRFYSPEKYNEIRGPQERVQSFLLENCFETNFSVILSCSNEPALRTELPLALFLHFELGILSRPPAPWLLQYDPMGLYEQSSFGSLDKIELDEKLYDDVRLIGRLGRQSIDLLCQNSRRAMSLKLIEFLKVESDPFLLPMPRFPDPTTRKFVGRELTEGELISAVTHALPPDARLIVTQHPSSEIDTDGTHPAIDDPNVLIVPSGSGYKYSHEYFPFIKSVIVINSMVGAQAKLAGKKLYCASKSGLSAISDGYIEFGQDPHIILKEVPIESHEFIMGYVLAFLHLPHSIWDTGYGRAYIDHLRNGGTVRDLVRNENTRRIVPRVVVFYRNFLLRLASMVVIS